MLEINPSSSSLLNLPKDVFVKLFESAEKADFPEASPGFHEFINRHKIRYVGDFLGITDHDFRDFQDNDGSIRSEVEAFRKKKELHLLKRAHCILWPGWHFPFRHDYLQDVYDRFRNAHGLHFASKDVRQDAVIVVDAKEGRDPGSDARKRLVAISPFADTVLDPA